MSKQGIAIHIYITSMGEVERVGKEAQRSRKQEETSNIECGDAQIILDSKRAETQVVL